MRRRMVLTRGAALATLGLAGCTSGDNTPTQAPTDTPASTPTQGAGTVSPTGSPPDTATTDREPTTKTSSPDETSPDTPTSSPTPAPDQEVSVGPGFSFEPATFEIPTGGTVLWIWEARGHNVKPSNTPSEADWTGTPGGEFETFDGGHTYWYTFEVPGEYDYYCAPHRSSGMTGSFSVG